MENTDRPRRRPERRGRNILGLILAVVGVVAIVAIAAFFALPTLIANNAVDATSTPAAPVPVESVGPSTPIASDVPFVGVQGEIPDSTSINGDPKLRDDVLMTYCAQAPGGWQALGTAANTADKTRTFDIVVIFTDAQARIITSQKTSVTVPAGEKTSWSATAEFTAPEGTTCVLAGVDSDD